MVKVLLTVRQSGSTIAQRPVREGGHLHNCSWVLFQQTLLARALCQADLRYVCPIDLLMRCAVMTSLRLAAIIAIHSILILLRRPSIKQRIHIYVFTDNRARGGDRILIFFDTVPGCAHEPRARVPHPDTILAWRRHQADLCSVEPAFSWVRYGPCIEFMMKTEHEAI